MDKSLTDHPDLHRHPQASLLEKTKHTHTNTEHRHREGEKLTNAQAKKKKNKDTETRGQPLLGGTSRAFDKH
jgi:hypothetical protein